MTRKFLRNTTSVALCIGVALPQLAAAQPVTDSIVLAAADEVAQAATAVILPPADEDEEQAEQAAEADAAPEAEAVAEAEVEAEAVPETDAEPEPEPVAEPKPEPEPEPVAEAAPEPVAEPAAETPVAETGAAETATDAAPAAETASDATPEAQPATTADPDADALARALAEQEEAASNAAEAADATDAAAAEAAPLVPLQEPEAAEPETQPETDAPDAGAPADAAADPAADETETDETALPDAGELEAALADAVEIPEAEAPTTDAAREAAAADTAPEAAALAESEPVTTTQAEAVTEETSRSATEDFLTDLKGALRDGGVATTAAETAAASDSTASDSKDRSNLEKTLRQAVLPALAGLVVGQMLSNNREVSLNTGDRVVVTRPDGSQEIIKDDNALLLRPGSTVQTQEYADGSTRTIVTRDDGSQVVTIRDANLRVLRRSLIHADGRTVELLDDTVAVQPVNVATLPPPARPITLAPGQQMTEEALREALRRETQVNRTFTLGQIRNIPEVRALVAPVDIQAITFDTGSAAIKSDQAQALAALGRVIAESIRQNPREIYLIEGHTDTVGADAMNLALSDRRAESVALALSQFFDVPPENLVVQGYGEQFLKVQREGDIRENRRASVRRITDLLARN
ncbi:OmpA family protein [Paracoccus alkenifer]|uniref:OmpA family protein n=1 Tax=Paracoccus alkenifer TaxID=65735 RepID=A0A1H6K3H5_9RHOB|nr:OmpA family protein [Paracoccus alkenifer]SEH69831.1 OmpA family protein [Paracoccus alkenifer]